MSRISLSQKLLLSVCATIGLFTLALIQPAAESVSRDKSASGGLRLQAPPFLRRAAAADVAQIDTSVLEKEAGISAYAKLNKSFSLSAIPARLKAVQKQTDEYIAGLMVVPGFEKIDTIQDLADVQVYVHRDGWIFVYLTRWQPASMMFDWLNFDTQRLESTTLENALRFLAEAVGEADPNVSYFDFRYPQATNLLLAADRVDGSQVSDSLAVTIPLDFQVFEVSWSHAAKDWRGNYPCVLVLNEKQISSIGEGGLRITNGKFEAKGFPSGSANTFAVTKGYAASCYDGVSIIYKEASK